LKRKASPKEEVAGIPTPGAIKLFRKKLNQKLNQSQELCPFFKKRRVGFVREGTLVPTITPGWRSG